jgi:hypothetical protein
MKECEYVQKSLDQYGKGRVTSTGDLGNLIIFRAAGPRKFCAQRARTAGRTDFTPRLQTMT